MPRRSKSWKGNRPRSLWACGFGGPDCILTRGSWVLRVSWSCHVLVLRSGADGPCRIDDLRSTMQELISHAEDAHGRGFALGSTGETVYLDDLARRQVVEALVSAHEQLPFVEGILEPTAPRIEAVAMAVPAPVLAYNIPSNLCYSLPLRAVARLIEDGVIAGIKDGSADLTGLRELVRSPHPQGALYLTGSDELFNCVLAVGANGSVADLANVVPELSHADWTLRMPVILAQIQGRISCLARLYRGPDPSAGINSTQIGSIKTALALLRVIASDKVSVPMRTSSASRRDYITAVLKQARLIEPHHSLGTPVGV